MNKSETIKILSILNVAYLRFEVKDMQKTALMVELWQKSFADIPFDLVEVAIQKLMLESPYPPTIADVAKRIADIKNPSILTDAEAWEEVTRAMRKWGIYNQDNAIDSMSEITRRAVKSIGFYDICVSENPDIIRAQFRMAYNSLVERKKEDDLIPERLKQQIAQIGNDDKSMLPHGNIPRIGISD